MAHRKIREYQGKHLLAKYLNLDYKALLITPQTNLDTLSKIHPWLETQPLVAKPDQLFGKRKQYNLVLINANWPQTKQWLTEHQNKQITLGKATDILTHFLIEPYIPHTEEYYINISSQRNNDLIQFSTQGGFNIEERWDSLLTIQIPLLETLTEQTLSPLISKVPPQHKTAITEFILHLYQLYQQFHFVSLEINPFTLIQNQTTQTIQTTFKQQIILLDLVAQVDDCAQFKIKSLWQNLEFPTPFGQHISAAEQYIKQLDENSGASLKLTILNPNGRIWNILSGGGASVICLDSLVSLGLEHNIANYGEYSGNPTTPETYEYTKTILKLMTTTPSHPNGKILLIAGAIANFTDIEKTFKGIIQALKEYQTLLKEQHISIYVRRGGPNDHTALQLIKTTCEQLQLPIQVYGPETAMTNIMPLIAQKINE